MQRINEKRAAWLTALSATASVLAGCATGSSNSLPTAVPASVASMRGSVHGGQQPVAGATVQLYAVGGVGYGSAATALLGPTPVTTTAGGNFTLPAYNCPTPSTPVYLVGTGGSPGLGGNQTNPNLALMAALGPCGNLSAATFISVNELTTVASVYALSPFMAGTSNAYASIGTSGVNAVGLSNAMADVNVLVNVATGAMPGSTTVAGATLPSSEINTLADIIAACVNSGGGTQNDNSNCGTLFASANPGGTPSSAPTDTITALMNIAQHPASSTANVLALYTLATPTAPYQPTLTKVPNDFTLAVTFGGGSLSAPSSLAADASGDIWITNSGANTVTELAHTGVALSGTGYTGGLSQPSAIAFAPDGTVWVTNQGNNTVSRMTAGGSAYAGSPYAGGGLNQPRSIAFDSLGTAWIANSGNASVTTINSSGATLTNYAPAAGSGPVAIAVDPH